MTTDSESDTTAVSASDDAEEDERVMLLNVRLILDDDDDLDARLLEDAVREMVVEVAPVEAEWPERVDDAERADAGESGEEGCEVPTTLW